MVSEKILINDRAEHMPTVNAAAEAFAAGMKLTHRATLQFGLLVEETLGMTRAMVEEFYGQLWFEGENQRCEIHLQATADIDSDQKFALLSVSSSGQNALKKGFMGMIGEFFSRAAHGIGASIDAYGEETLMYGMVHNGTMDTAAMMGMTTLWTLHDYRHELDEARSADANAEEAWDELEKSIVARLADDVVVGVKGSRLELVIVKDFAK